MGVKNTLDELVCTSMRENIPSVDDILKKDKKLSSWLWDNFFNWSPIKIVNNNAARFDDIKS